ncbi:External NADH-ubiquinone oxidoreductase 1, mitochondrial [Candida viswanathii]|uniref:NADH:ubiquinone reductase (non-electrogenic) n=1 Tax=Candida viswanathii TaxID=5486 RepID=A0A367YMM5_9ASCO|nr:External NADH-ubiquinone oxidoreductase 1, mitochondrial [Candida viswanathii]
MPARFFRKFVRYTFTGVALTAVGATSFLGYKVYKESHPVNQVPQSPTFPSGEKKKSLVILGSGWGAISLLKNLDTTLYNVVLVSPRNYFLFTPLLPSVPTGTIDMRSIIEPVRAVTSRCPGEVVYLEAEAIDVDPKKNILKVQQSTTVHSGHTGQSTSSASTSISQEHGLDIITTEVKYDYLVVAIGAQPSTFGIPGVAENSIFVKEVHDSVKIKKKLIDLIEAANLLPEKDPERLRLLHVIVCGGGPTGVETAGEIQDYIDQDLKKWMPHIAKDMKVTLVESQPVVLHTFSPKLVDFTNHIFKDTNINLVTNSRIVLVDNSYASIFNKKDKTTKPMPYGMLIWATGNSTRHFTLCLIDKIPEQINKRGFLVDDRLRLQGAPNIFALGDCSITKYPATAQVAFQQGCYLAQYFDKLQKVESLRYKLQHEEQPPSDFSLKRLQKLERTLPQFVYNYRGSLAYIGSEKAVADVAVGSWSNVASGGNLTYLFWRSAYVMMCLSIKNQILVCFDWVKVYFFGRDCSRE